jgi:hypothetical protein
MIRAGFGIFQREISRCDPGFSFIPRESALGSTNAAATDMSRWTIFGLLRFSRNLQFNGEARLDTPEKCDALPLAMCFRRVIVDESETDACLTRELNAGHLIVNWAQVSP